MRFTPADELLGGAPFETPSSTVDNDEPPVSLLGEGLFVENQDDSRGILVPFTVLDAEGDTVQVVFQWRRPGEDFPDPGPRPHRRDPGGPCALPRGTDRDRDPRNPAFFDPPEVFRFRLPW